MPGLLDKIRLETAKRPWWINCLWLFCLYMTFVYMPWDVFWKPYERWEEVWFGLTIRGWVAKLTEPLHWAIYAAGSYGLWKMKAWLWPWISIYCAQVAIGMLVFNITEGPSVGDGRGGGIVAAIPIFLFLSWLTILLWRSKRLFVGDAANSPSDTQFTVER